MFSLCAQEVQMAQIMSRFHVSDSRAYFLVDKGTIWKVTRFEKRWRGPLEWFRGDDLGVPEQYLYSVSDWGSLGEMEIYPKFVSPAPEASASNETEIHKATHILVNRQTGRVLYGYETSASQAMLDIYTEGKAAGYNEGREEGYKAGVNAEKSKSYQEAVDNAFRRGFNQGVSQNQNPPPYPGR